LIGSAVWMSVFCRYKWRYRTPLGRDPCRAGGRQHGTLCSPEGALPAPGFQLSFLFYTGVKKGCLQLSCSCVQIILSVCLSLCFFRTARASKLLWYFSV